jgi:hypothetical protein
MDNFSTQETFFCKPCIKGKQHKEKFPRAGLQRSTDY